MLLGLISSSSLLIPLIIGLFTIRKISNHQFYFFLFILFSVLFEIVSISLVIKSINNHWMFKFFLVCDFLFFLWFFNQFIIAKLWYKLITWFVVLFIFIDTLNVLFFHFWPESRIFFVIFPFLIFQSIRALIQLLDRDEPVSHPIFWISAARVFYYLIVFIIIIYSNYASKSFDNKLFTLAFMIFNATGNIVCNVMYGISFLCKKVNL
jgi:hypothetical protein